MRQPYSTLTALVKTRVLVSAIVVGEETYFDSVL